MNDILNLSDAIPGGVNQLDLLPTLFGFLMCIIMSFVVRAFYIQRSFSLTGKSHIGSVLPILSAVVFLVIIVVKSSLALSLGLVGALSIVRFRTPIKEPEELVYLFLAIAIGLGYGAGHVLITTVLVTLILVVIFFWLSNRNVAKTSEYNLVIKWSNADVSFEELSQTISESVLSLKLVRLDRGDKDNSAVMLVVPKTEINFDSVINSLLLIDKAIKVTFFEAKTNW